MNKLAVVLLATCALVAAGEPRLEPLLLDDHEAIAHYVAAFPATEHRIVETPRKPADCLLQGWLQCVRIWWRTPYIGRFFVEPPPRDAIKNFMIAGYVWEPHIVASIAHHAAPGSVTLDVGAYMGTHAVLMGRMVGSMGRVYAFEPQRKMFRELHHNVRLNGLDDVVVPLRYALGAENAIVEMDPPRHGFHEGGVAVGAGGDRVELRTLDSFGFNDVSLLKIDVEGAEDAVLAGAAETIRVNKPVLLIEILGGVDYDTASSEQHERINATKATIEAFGYRIAPLLANKLWHKFWPAKYDYIALPK